jgi:Mn2+/Fe2+ NRAMP family transporter
VSQLENAVEKPKGFSFLRSLGPGLITGASDDDPSGIATYSQVGARYGYDLGWTLVFSYPLMCAIQEISARIGRVTGRGLRAISGVTIPHACSTAWWCSSSSPTP